jgi:peptidoglycan/LPS O-acetylase OafA/YrhL
LNQYFSRLFSRPTHNFKPIDGVRAIAVIWVIIFHAWLFQYNDFQTVGDGIFDSPFLIWISKGDLGVDLFFVISGFLIGSILFKEYKRTQQINFKRFYARRFLRLMPVYVFSMILGVYFLNETDPEGWKDAWSNLLYINNFVRNSYMGWTWSLAIEEQFYLVIPFLIASIIPRFKNKLIPFSLLALITIGLTYHYSFNILKFEVPFNSVFLDDAWEDWFWDYYMLTHLRYGGLLSGVVGAYLFVYHSEQLASFFTKNKRLVNVLFLGSIAVFVLISSIALGQWTMLQSSIFDGMDPSIPQFYEVIHREIFCYVVMFILLSCMYSDSIYVQPINRFLSAKFFYPIAQVSYSAYLFHEMFMFWFFPKFNAMAVGQLDELTIVLLNSLISLVAIIFGATLMYLFIEQPFQDIKNKIGFGPSKSSEATPVGNS